MNIRTWTLLLLAIGSEIGATISLKLSEGFTRLVPGVIVIIGYGISFFALSQALKFGMPLGLGYAIWSGLGTIGAAVAGVILFGNKLNGGAVAGIALIVVGVFVLNMFSQGD